MVFWRTYRQTPNVFYSHVCVYHVCVDDCSCVWTYVYVCIVYTCGHDCVYVDDCSCNEHAYMCTWLLAYVDISACVYGICMCVRLFMCIDTCECIYGIYVCMMVHMCGCCVCLPKCFSCGQNTGKRFHWNFCKLVKESQSFSWSSQFYTILITLVYFTESWKWQANTHPYITMHSWYRIKVKNLNVWNLNGQNTHSKRHRTLSCLTQQDWSSL